MSIEVNFCFYYKKKVVLNIVITFKIRHSLRYRRKEAASRQKKIGSWVFASPFVCFPSLDICPFSCFFSFPSSFFLLLPSKEKVVGRYKKLEKEAHKVWKDMDDHIFCFRSSLMAIYSSRRLLCYWQLSNANRSLSKEIFSSIYLLEGVIYNIWIRCVWLLPFILNICMF